MRRKKAVKIIELPLASLARVVIRIRTIIIIDFFFFTVTFQIRKVITLSITIITILTLKRL